MPLLRPPLSEEPATDYYGRITSIDQFGGKNEKCWRHRQSKRFSGLKVDDKVKCGRPLDW